jgi:hypothetical protein
MVSVFKMKGIVDIEFILSVIVFLSTITFVTFIIISNIPVFHGEAASEDLRARSYQISELLFFDQGYPADWIPANALRLGLSAGERYTLSETKIANLDTLCQNDYNRVKSLLGQDYRTNILIEINYSGSSAVCGLPTAIRPESKITRFATLSDGRIVRMVVGVSGWL